MINSNLFSVNLNVLRQLNQLDNTFDSFGLVEQAGVDVINKF